MEDYLSLDDNDTKRIVEIKEFVNKVEQTNEEFHDSEAPKVGEGYVEANTTPYLTTLKKHEPQLIDVMEKKYTNTNSHM